MGWGIGPVRQDEFHTEIFDKLGALYPLKATGILSKWAREIREFNQDIELGDVVATYNPRKRTYHIGLVRSLQVDPEQWILCKWQNDHVHKVDWLYRVSRDTLPKGFGKANLDRRSTLHRLTKEASAVMREHCVV